MGINVTRPSSGGGGSSFDPTKYFELGAATYTSAASDTETDLAFATATPGDSSDIEWAIGDPETVMLTSAGLYLVEGIFEFLQPATSWTVFSVYPAAPDAVSSIIGGGAQSPTFTYLDNIAAATPVVEHETFFLVVNGADTLPLDVFFRAYHDCASAIDVRATLRLAKIA